MENMTAEETGVCNQRGGSFLATPHSLNFYFNDNIKVMEKELTLTNVSDKTGRLSILPPITKYFNVKYPKKFMEQAWIAPGLSVTVKVIFEPDITERQRHYDDYIGIMWGTLVNRMKIIDNNHSNSSCAVQEREMMQIPLHAQLHTLQSSLPDEIYFGHVQLGKRVKSRFTIFPMQGQKVVYYIVIPNEDTDFTIYPTYGVLSEEDIPQEITIEFQPSAYKITEVPIQVCIPNCSTTPFIIRLTGICKPWTQISKSSKVREDHQAFSNTGDQNIDPEISDHALSNESQEGKYDHKSKKKDTSKNNLCHFTKKKPKPKGLPLNTIHGVSKFLSMKPAQDPYFHLLGPLGMYQEDEKDMVKALEKTFKTRVEKERQRLQNIFGKMETQVGPSTDDAQIEKMAEILVDRTIALKIYEDSKALEKPECFLSRTSPMQLRQRIMRDVNEIKNDFDGMENNSNFRE
ncbi:uncharacterized protein LOC124158281 isoform X2 [Ischnura elegans]|uniref:uncharacterized protein LOC124158281 isoform X2 n=1 Tax=Ischnura elegans TaxID=197161 RepID=UPI001ED8A714|nr:uncharacterized protein LOC124158281 isoform X2 [Ischnura elegans]